MSEPWGERIDKEVDAMAGMLTALRRHLHQHPEPSREEFRTAEHLAVLLADSGIRHRLIPSGRGVIAEGRASSRGLRVALRADLDALRIHDAKEVEYRSCRDGVMHACGHDAHAAMAVGAALSLHRAAEFLPDGVSWRAVFQPAEEVGEGAAEMVAAGAVDDVDAILALHVDPVLDVGRVGYREGVLTAFTQTIEAKVLGRGGHAARPHLTADPIAAAAQFVTAAYQAIPRTIDAREPVVVSFGAISGGTSPNVIPDVVTLRGTLRTLGRAEAQHARDRLSAVAQGIAQACGVGIAIGFGHPIDAVVNDPRVTRAFARAAAGAVGPEGLEAIALPSMGGEDFSGYLARVPGCLLRLGVGSGAAPRPGLHNPLFDIDERALVLGAKVLARGVVTVALELGMSP